MNFSIDQKTTVALLKTQFSSYFPHLKIEVYDESHAVGEASAQDHQISDDVLLSEINPNVQSGHFSFDPEMKVRDFEQGCKANMGLNVQVFRLSGKLWLQTTKTDDWSLEKQEGKGKRSSDALE
ncbi:MAG TPA: hypothetical protein PKC30_05975 [Saprospiraceae bacterium]|nr:hypothetical protein [Saprospiraceae bacterium]